MKIFSEIENPEKFKNDVSSKLFFGREILAREEPLDEIVLKHNTATRTVTVRTL